MHVHELEVWAVVASAVARATLARAGVAKLNLCGFGWVGGELASEQFWEAVARRCILQTQGKLTHRQCQWELMGINGCVCV